VSSLFSFLESLFCVNCYKEIEELKEDKLILTRNYQSLMMEKLQLVLNCNKDSLELHQKIRELETLLDRLEEAGLESFNWPKIPNYNYATYDVSGVKDFYDVEFVRADIRYLLFSKEDWVEILNVIHPLVKEALTRWEVDISDCDNWSNVASAFISIAFKKSGYTKQGAFALSHTIPTASSRHAYNLFVDLDHKVWLYEPQTNQLKDEMKDGSGIYRTGYVWFMN